jgi:hypothetical protein
MWPSRRLRWQLHDPAAASIRGGGGVRRAERDGDLRPRGGGAVHIDRPIALEHGVVGEKRIHAWRLCVRDPHGNPAHARETHGRSL